VPLIHKVLFQNKQTSAHLEKAIKTKMMVVIILQLLTLPFLNTIQQDIYDISHFLSQQAHGWLTRV